MSPQNRCRGWNSGPLEKQQELLTLSHLPRPCRLLKMYTQLWGLFYKSGERLMVITNNSYNYSGILLSDISLHAHNTTCDAAGWCKDDELEWECGHCDIASGHHHLPPWPQDCVTTEVDPVTQTLIVSLITWTRGTKTPLCSQCKSDGKKYKRFSETPLNSTQFQIWELFIYGTFQVTHLDHGCLL